MRQKNRLVSAATARTGSLWILLGAVMAGAGTLLLARGVLTDPKTDWLARARHSIESREYHASPNQVGLQAPNRAQNLRTYFETTGIRVHDRTAPGSPELLTLALAGVGRADKLTALEPGVIAADGAHVEIRRDGLVEWYVNSEAGLEQGFSVAKRPAGEGPLVVELALKGAKASMRDEAVIFSTTSGRRLRYDHLVVADGSGRTLSARLLVPEPERVRILVEDAGAVYPLVVDPILSEAVDSQLESNQVGAELGVSVAGAGDVDGDGYDDVIVGAPLYDHGQTNEGAAFIFLGSASGIADGSPSTAAAQLESDQASANFGTKVAGAGDVNGDGYDDVIVGASFYGAGETQEGAAFVFLGSASGITDGDAGTADAVLESNQAVARFASVAGAGDVNGDGYDDVIVGAYLYDAGENDEGAAFVFLGSVSGIADGNPATAAAQLESNQADSQFGLSVAGSGDVNGDGYDDVTVGALLYDAGETDEGAAFVFLGSASGVADGNPSTSSTQLESDQTSAQLGYRVAGVGDVNGDGYDDVGVGANLYDAGETDEGAAFVFLGSASGIVDGNLSNAATQLESNQEDAVLGWSLAGTGDVNGDGYDDVIVGAPRYDAGDVDEGAAFVFLGSASGITDGNPATAYAQLESDQNQLDGGLAGSVARAGDLNGDGYADVIVGQGGFFGGQGGEGAAFVYLGEADGDADHVADSTDNCLSRANPSQLDVDSDSFGNACDADFDQTGATGLSDYGVFKVCSGQMVPYSGGPVDDPTCAESDMDGSGAVGLADFGLFKAEWGTPPGP